MKIFSYTINTILILASIFLSFCFVDYLFVLINPEWAKAKADDYKLPMRKTDKSYLFELIPDVSDHNSSGFRGPEFSIEKPEDVFRIVMLGDSVTYGLYVGAAQAYPALIEKMLAGNRINGRKIEVINAGVPAYTTYNEVHYYKDMLKDLDPDLLILGFCMNDVVDPFFHWSVLGEPDLSIPDAALPNKDYHAEKLRIDGVNALVQFLPDWSNIKHFLTVRHLTNQTLATRKFESDGKNYPVYLALEQPLTMDVYNDYESQESQWLRRQVKELSEALKEEQTDFLFLILPLAYQLQNNYPFSPTANFEKFCEELKLDCLDVLDSMKGQPIAKLFQLIDSGYNDIWHLTAEGHEKVAIEIIDKKIKPQLIGNL